MLDIKQLTPSNSRLLTQLARLRNISEYTFLKSTLAISNEDLQKLLKLELDNLRKEIQAEIDKDLEDTIKRIFD